MFARDATAQGPPQWPPRARRAHRLPEGEIVELVRLEDALARGRDEFHEEERARLHEALHESIEQMKAGETIDAAEALAELRAHR
jgi:hypothetical protein